MVQKIKRFVVFVLFSMFFSLLGGKVSKASNNIACVVPKQDGKMTYNGSATYISSTSYLSVDDEHCY